MKLESDLSCHPRLSGARGRVINNSSLSARLLQNARSSQRCRIIHLLQIVKHRVIPVSAPRPRHLEFIIETASHSRTRRNKSQSMLLILLRQAILWSDNLLIQSTVYFNWSDYDFWGCNWLINVDCLNYLRSLWASSGWWLPGDGLRTLFAVSCCRLLRPRQGSEGFKPPEKIRKDTNWGFRGFEQTSSLIWETQPLENWWSRKKE